MNNKNQKSEKRGSSAILPDSSSKAKTSGSEERPDSGWRRNIYEVIFEADTVPGKTFDIILLIAIVGSVVAVLLESVERLRIDFGNLLYLVEWFFTLLFTLEYFVRIISVKRPRRYIFSFFGLIDLLAIIPTYLSLVIAGAQTLLVIRIFRLLRVFRVFKLTRYLGEASTLLLAMKASRRKITVFLGVVLSIVITMGSIMYLIEGPPNGFTSIPRSIYWAIVTLTTVGYGDIAPGTVVGQTLASFLMILGYAIIAVPTGIVTVEMSRVGQTEVIKSPCHACGETHHINDSDFCRSCGGSFDDPIDD